MSDTEGFFAYNLPPIKDVLARAYREKGDTGGAIAEYERLLAVDERSRDRRLVHPKYHFRLAQLCRETGRSEEARRQYERFLGLWQDADGDLPEVPAARAALDAN
jgi:tetratricopeptide (TPR) repeat protein